MEIKESAFGKKDCSILFVNILNPTLKVFKN